VPVNRPWGGCGAFLTSSYFNEERASSGYYHDFRHA
jgi:hypothetical protein